MKRYYYVCVCDAKFFSRKSSEVCPRCGTELHSDDEQTPPWERYGSSETSKPGELAGEAPHPKKEQAQDGAAGEPQDAEGRLG